MLGLKKDIATFIQDKRLGDRSFFILGSKFSSYSIVFDDFSNLKKEVSIIVDK